MFKPSFAKIVEDIQKNEKITPELVDAIKNIDLEPELVATYQELTETEKKQLDSMSQTDLNLKKLLDQMNSLDKQSYLEDASTKNDSEEDDDPEIIAKLKKIFKDISPEEFFKRLEEDVKNAEQISDQTLQDEEEKENKGYHL